MRCLAFPVVVVSLVLVGCGSTDSVEPGSTTTETAAVAPTTTTSPGNVTTTGPSTTSSLAEPSTTTPATTTPAQQGLLGLLVADDEGVRVLADGRVVEVFVGGGPVSVAFPDLTGGVVFQRAAEGSPIERVIQPGDQPVVLVSGRVWLEDVTVLDGRTQVVYRTLVEDPDAGCAEDDDECRWQTIEYHMMLRDLSAGSQVDLGIVGGFESSWIYFDLGQERMVVLTATYGEPDACGAVWDRQELTDQRDESAWIGGGGPFWRRCDFGPGADGDTGSLRAGLAPDGSTVAYVETLIREDGHATTFVVIDPVTLAGLRRVVLEPSFVPAWIDWDGGYAVVGDWEGTVRLLVGPDDTVTDLATLASGESTFLLWRESP
jgi:hypothetical protein